MKRHGCINWDSANPDTYFGNYTLNSLKASPERLPYYTCITEDGYAFVERTQEDYDRELQYAIDAGIDFFAYCWYTKDIIKSPTYPKHDAIAEHLPELTKARFLHMNSQLREKIKLCAIITSHEATDEDYSELIAAMQEPYYEKTPDGRPLVLVFNILTDEAAIGLERILLETKKAGLEPYVVGLDVFSNSVISEEQNKVLQKVDALSAYADVANRITAFSELVDWLIDENAHRATRGKTVFPHFSSGWNPEPRIKNPVPWVTYRDVDYAKPASAQELIDGAIKLKKWLNENKDICNDDYVLTFAWNEFEEGGWICPTLAPDGSVDTERVEAFAEISKIFKQ